MLTHYVEGWVSLATGRVTAQHSPPAGVCQHLERPGTGLLSCSFTLWCIYREQPYPLSAVISADLIVFLCLQFLTTVLSLVCNVNKNNTFVQKLSVYLFDISSSSSKELKFI